MAFNPALHPHAPAGSPAGGQFTAGGGQQKQPAKTAPAKKTTAKGRPAAKKPTFAQLKAWTTAVNNGQGARLTPQQRAAVAAAHKAHTAHVAHVKHMAALKAKGKTAAKPKTTAKKPAAKKTARK